MYEGFMRFGGTEIVNMDRLMSYVKAGFAPQGVTVTDGGMDCEGLGEALGDPAYSTPLADQPPWFDAKDPDAQDFAGVLPLGFTGLNGSSRTVDMVDTLRDGSVPLRPRHPGKTIAASAILVGRTDCSVEVGLSWLTDVLHTVCHPMPPCSGQTLDLFTCCPAPVCTGEGAEDPDTPMATHSIAWDDPSWLIEGGTRDDTDLFTPTHTEVARNAWYNPSVETDFNGMAGTSGGQVAYNGRFAEADGVDGWHEYTLEGLTNSIEWTDERSHSGGGSMKITSQPLFPSPFGHDMIVRVRDTDTYYNRVTPGQNYGFTAWTRAKTDRRFAIPQLAWHASDDETISVKEGSAVLNKTGSWVQISVSGVAPAGATHVIMRVYFEDCQGSEVHYLDDVEFDGQATGSLPTVTRDTTVGFAGSASIKTAGGASAVVYPSWRGWAGVAMQTTIGGVPLLQDGHTYTVSGYVRNTSAPPLQAWLVTLGHSVGEQATPVSAPMNPAPGVWQRWHFTFVYHTGDAPSIYITPQLVSGGTWTSGQHFHVDGVQVTEGTTLHDYFDGDTADTATDVYYWTGTAHASPSVHDRAAAGLILGPPQTGYREFEVLWDLTAAGTDVTVTPVAYDADGTTVLVTGDPVTVTGSGTVSVLYSPTPADLWRPGLLVGTPGAHITLSVRHREYLTVEACLAPYRRTYTDVVCIDGPTVVEDVQVDCASRLMRVEWTWVAGDPYRYGSPRLVAADVNSGDGTAGDTAAGVTVALVDDALDHAATECPTPTPFISCADDPCMPPVESPPLPPHQYAPWYVPPDDYTRTAMQFDEGVVPGNSAAAMWIRLVNDEKPKTGVRLRLWADPDPDFGVDDECGFFWEARIPYIPADQTVTISPMEVGGASLTCSDGTTTSPRLAGEYGGPFEQPIVACGQRYFMTVDVPNTYPTGCAGGYTEGHSEGTLDWSVSLYPREG